MLAYRSSDVSTIKKNGNVRHTPAFVPSTASADAPDIVRYRFDIIRNGANALGAELNFSSVAPAKEGAGTGTRIGVGCGFDAGADTGVCTGFDFFSFEGVVTTLESES